MFFGSVALYLFVRKAALQNINTSLSNLAMFSVPLCLFAADAAMGRASLSVSTWQLFVICVSATIFAYGGNKASLKAISKAPNPGYSLVLSKSYVLFTTIIAVAFLNQELAVSKALAIVLIVIFAAIILANKSADDKATDKKWVPLSFIAFFAWGFLSLAAKYLFNNAVSTQAFLLYLYAIVTLCIIAFDKIRIKNFMQLTASQWFSLSAIGVFSTIFNYGHFQAIRLAPNVGYINAINAASIALVTIMAVIFFGDDLTSRKAIGVAGITAGLLLLLA